MSTSNFNAGIDTSDVIVSYAEESSWGVTPAVAFQAIRLNGESLSETKSRTRPGEIRASGDVAHGVTTQVEAAGGINGGLSYGTFDAWLEGLVNGAWTTALAIDDSSNDIIADSSLSGGGVGFSSTTTDKFNSIVVGQWIRVFGFVATSGVNNGVYRVVRRTTGATPELEVSATAGNGANIADETPASGTQSIRGSMVRNGTTVCTYHIQKELAASLFLNYAGSYISGGGMSSELGGFTEVNFDFLSKSQTPNTSDQSTGSVVDAPSGRVMDTITGVSQMSIDDIAVTEVIQSISFSVTKEGARGQYGIGSSSAGGMARGSVAVTGTMQMFFSDFTQFNKYVAETDHRLFWQVSDDAGNAYISTLPAVTLMNPEVVAGGPDTDIVQEFEVEANRAETSDTVYAGVTIQIDRLDATA